MLLHLRAPLIPPSNFGLVQEDIYRSGMPIPDNYRFLQRLQLKTIIYLAPELPEDDFYRFMSDEGITMVHLGRTAAQTGWDAVTEEIATEALRILLNPDRYPVCIMCLNGRHRTGTVVGCFRKLQKWNLTSIFEEYRRFAGTAVSVLNEQFIESFLAETIHVTPDQRNLIKIGGRTAVS